MEKEPLLVIDLQPAFTRKVTPQYLSGVMAFVSEWPEDLTYWLRFMNHPDSLYERHIDYSNCTLSTESALLDCPPPHDNARRKVVPHFGYAPPADFIEQLKKDGHKRAHLCGVDTDACVMAACFVLWDAGIQPVIHAEQCQSSRGPEMHHAAISMMFRQFGMHSMR